MILSPFKAEGVTLTPIIRKKVSPNVFNRVAKGLLIYFVD